MNQKLLITFTFLLFFYTTSFSQKLIQGKVLSKESQKPLAGVNISLQAKLLTISDSLGNFSFTIEENQQNFIFSAIDFQTESFVLNPEQNNIIYLQVLDLQLNEVIVRGYENNRVLAEVPAPIVTLNAQDLQRFNNTSFVSAVNTLPGVRMEERSPGSYRLAIRGSALRSPFGVRNVKVYWNDMPLTDAGGNTYFNGLDFNNLQGLEIIKGPGASLYGAGTGGVLLLTSPQAKSNTNSLKISSLVGSYGLFGINTQYQFANEKQQTTISLAHQQADGYREQSKMQRDMLNYQGRFFLSEHKTLNINVFYSDLFYQTPGGLTKAQMEANPQQARPAGGPNRGAIEQNAGIYQKTFYVGLSQEYDFNAHWTNRTSLYGTLTQLENPSIRNYERRIEPGLGGRSVTTYQFAGNQIKGKWSFGGEFQLGYNNTKDFGNRFGKLDTLQTDDEIRNWQYLLFSQIELDLPAKFYLTLGGSLNQAHYNFVRLAKPPIPAQNRNFSPQFLPRIALLKKITENFSTYLSASWGFSPPTTAEIRPSTGTFNFDLKPEKGTNYELGMRGNFFQNKLQFDLSAYIFQLDQTIVTRRTQDGADYFTNAGNTDQKGLELMLNYIPIQTHKSLFINYLRIFSNFTYQDFKFKNYQIQTNQINDFSGNKLTGVPQNTWVMGLDLATKIGFYLNFTFNYTDQIPLNDGNSEFANSYSLLGGRLGYKQLIFNKLQIDIWTGIDNALDEKYSLGNDLNAVGNRFYNPAMNRNYYGGLSLKYNFK